MTPITQLIIVICIIVLFLYLISKVIRFVVKLALFSIGLLIVFYILNIFFIQNNLTGIIGNEIGFILEKADSIKYSILCYNENYSLSNESFDPENISSIKGKIPIVVINLESNLFNSSLMQQDEDTKLNNQEVCSIIRENINKTSLFRLTTMYVLGDLKVYPKTKIDFLNKQVIKLKNNKSENLKNKSSLFSKIINLVKI
ncbi:MAG: hypothetical protein PWP03_399 [Candidatus Woesearchaeota archaeon]|nr:hypothetical protein [Candidatus Woesearchaeota archaeon]